MKFTELVEEIKHKEKKHPYTIALEGVIGSGKSYQAEHLLNELGGKSLIITTDLFVTVGRHDWVSELENDRIDLRRWYDLAKIRKTLTSVKNMESFTIKELYDLGNGEFDDTFHVDATELDYLILEGLFSCDENLDDFIDLKIFLDVSIDTAMRRAEARDETVRHLDHKGWELKKSIFYDHYVPYLDSHRQRADLLLDID